MELVLPDVFALEEKVNGNPIHQLAERRKAVDGAVIRFARAPLQAHLFKPTGSPDEVLIVGSKSKKHLKPQDTRVILWGGASDRVPADLSLGAWNRHPLQITGPIDYAERLQGALKSWDGAFSYIEKDAARKTPGLRKPQIGALHAVQAHWSVTEAPGTIVMPTGTGKTDTMIAILVSARCSKVLVVVPTDALRNQIADNFLILGVLREHACQVLAESALYPIVGRLMHIPKSVHEVDDLFTRCHVIVTTGSIAGQCAEEVQDRMVSHCPYLFIDEAHHTEAPTWRAFKRRFQARRILQFTATPFREDGKVLESIIYKYPLRKAQEENFFRPIRFTSVVEFNPSKVDAAIAEKAVERLRIEKDKGQIVMARVENVERAKQVFGLYKKYAEFKPVELHTGIKSRKEREANRRAILSGESRIVVCVDMLGEGFDLPELKIAAFHDIRKTLAVTLQLAGRFVRAKEGVGDPTFIANVADVNVRDELRKLYARDPDWNVLLPEYSENAIAEQVSLQQFLSGFTMLPDEVPLKAVRPATSAVVYTTKCASWSPEKFREGIPRLVSCEQIYDSVNESEKTLVVVTAKREPLSWGSIENLFSWQWDLYLAYWWEEHGLLFLNASANAGEYKNLAEAICGKDVSLIKGQQVFRAFAGVNRLRLQNVGLTEQLGRNIRYTGRMGADVESGLADAQKQRAQKSVLAGNGFENGERTSVGASRKGRVWSHNRETVDKLVVWFRKIGTKLIDPAINPDDVLKGTLEEKTVSERPASMPLVIDWPEAIYKKLEAAWWIDVGEETQYLHEVAIELVSPTVDDPLRFALVTDTARTEIIQEFVTKEGNSDCRFVVDSGPQVLIKTGPESAGELIEEFFHNDPPVLWFADGSFLEGNQLVVPRLKHPPYDREKIAGWDWSGVNLKMESQGEKKDPSSIQARVIRELMTRPYVVIVDDDGKGELADIVAIRLEGNPSAPSHIDVELYHCKYSQKEEPGHRVKDLYEVCGQAQKCISWMRSHDRQTEMFTHLLRRDAQRRDRSGVSRIEKGDSHLLITIQEMSRTVPIRVSVFIVQPGLSKAAASRDQLQLLSVTESHLMETYQLPFGVICSE